jgi:hypothetical protein
MLLVAKPSFSLVVVEGCRKSLKRMHKLMLRRIDWEAQPLGAGPGAGPGAEGEGGGGEEGAQEEEEEELGDQEPNSCQLVWEVRRAGVLGGRRQVGNRGSWWPASCQEIIG